MKITPIIISIVISIGFITYSTSCKSKNDPDYNAWKAQLEKVYEDDQKFRKRLQDITRTEGPGTDEYIDLWSRQRILDSINLHIVEKMIADYGGYPGKSVLGEEASSTIFLVLQHAPDSIQEKYINMILQAAEDGEVNKREAALYHDRYLMNQELPQIYGSQVITSTFVDSLTGEEIDSTYVWPMRDTTNIDSLRMWNGMAPLNKYLQYYGLTKNNIRVIQ